MFETRFPISFSSKALGSLGLIATVWVVGLGAAQAEAQSPGGELFAEPFVVEHYIAQEDETGERYEAPTVVDTYGGSWIVSERPDGSRAVVDLARGEITEIRPEEGTYWTVGYDRLQRLIRRVNELEGTRPEVDPANPRAHSESSAKALERRAVTDWRIEDGPSLKSHGSRLPEMSAQLVTAGNIRHIRALAPEGAQGTAGAKAVNGGLVAEAWVDPSIRLSPAARAALARFERDALGADSVMEAIRNHADGAFPIRTLRTEMKSDGGQGKVEDVVLRLEKILAFDRDLIRVPEGLRRVSHPLEGLLAFMEREDRRQKMMSGEGSAEGDGYGGGES